MLIKQKLKNLTNKPGVYQMLDKSGRIIYVGKAKNLKNRVGQYLNKSIKSAKMQALVAKINDFEVIVTATETSALLLENDLIKQHQPQYNILLKDAKSYPYICVSRDKHPRVGFYRGNKSTKYQFFGPYPSAFLVRNSLTLLKKIFKVRQCSDSFYRARQRPCLEHQIKLCSAPCVGKISDKNYNDDVKMMVLFLRGEGGQILTKIAKKMQTAAKNMDFELAAHYRDQLIGLRKIQEQHSSQTTDNLDVISIAEQEGVVAIEVLFIRGGKQIGQQCIFPKNTKDEALDIILSAFLPLYYLGKNPPKQLLLSHKLADKKLLSEVLNSVIIDTVHKSKKHFFNIANLTLKENLQQYLLTKFSKKERLVALKKVLALSKLPKIIECFDISHSGGEATIASCVRFENGVPKPREYRQFNIKNITGGDDYAAMRDAVWRRYSRLQKEKAKMPDLVLIDGGLGQLNQAIMVVDSLGIEVKIVGVAKGEGRKVGLETLVMVADGETRKIKLQPQHPALLLVAHIRDEAHRFAIKNHRQKLAKKRITSSLESIEGIGKLRRDALLNHFGGLQEIQKASTDEMQKVSGISRQLAYKIKHHFNG